jgi:serine/threonine-protein kinase RsbW
MVSMILARANWPVDKLDDAMLVCDALSAHAPDYASDGVVSFTLERREQEIELRVEELCPEGAEAIVRDAMLPGVGNVLERIPKTVVAESLDGGSRLILVLSRS